MADIKKSELSKVSKEELATVIARYKKRDQKSRMQARQAAEQLTADLVTVGSGAGLGYLMGSRIASVENEKLGGDAEAVEEALKEKTQIAGIDLDLAIAGTAAALGLTDMAGNMSGFLRNVGIGGLTAYGSRKAFFMAIEARDKELGHGGKVSAEKPEFQDRFASGRYGHFGGRSKPPK